MITLKRILVATDLSDAANARRMTTITSADVDDYIIKRQTDTEIVRKASTLS